MRYRMHLILAQKSMIMRSSLFLPLVQEQIREGYQAL